MVGLMKKVELTEDGKKILEEVEVLLRNNENQYIKGFRNSKRA